METVRVLIVDDHPVVREGLAGMLGGKTAGTLRIEVAGEAEDGAQALDLFRRLRPDVVLMDLRMPGMDGVQAIERIREEAPEARILVLTTYDSDADILRAVEAGASGYLLKDSPRRDLFRAIEKVAQGESVLAPAVASRLMQRMRAPAEEALSAREIEVLQLVARGKSNRDIGKALHISTATVKTHLVRIFDKLDVSDRTAAVTVALERGIMRLEGGG
jgi:DNA-binding NarL/FixJ family response regulator